MKESRSARRGDGGMFALAASPLAADRATIETRGESYDVAEPEVIDAEEAFPLLSRLRSASAGGTTGGVVITDRHLLRSGVN